MATIKQGFVVNPESFWRPSYRISPFNTSYVARNQQILNDGVIDDKIIRQYFGESYFVFQNGKTAIYYALNQLDLQREDEVWICTTSDNKYISSCVTVEIERFCRWSRSFSKRTKAIFINHEFGFCKKGLDAFVNYGLPIIEDRALSFASQDTEGRTGRVGDFIIYSLPKFFPVNLGGILVCNKPEKYRLVINQEESLKDAISSLISYYLPHVNAIAEKRLTNFDYLEHRFKSLGFEPRFYPDLGEIPGVFLFRTNKIDVSAFKIFMQANGIESSVFYGEDVFFIPIHQELSVADLDFFYTLTQYFVQNGT